MKSTSLIPGAVTLKSLVSELHEVVDWFHLGVHLDVPDSELMKIKRSYLEVDDCKTQVLIFCARLYIRIPTRALTTADHVSCKDCFIQKISTWVLQSSTSR